MLIILFSKLLTAVEVDQILRNKIAAKSTLHLTWLPSRIPQAIRMLLIDLVTSYYLSYYLKHTNRL